MTVPQPTLSTARLLLIPADPSWALALLDYQHRNREHLARWEPRGGDMFYSELYWTMRLRQRCRDWQDGRGAAFLLVREGTPGRVAGTVTLSNIVRGSFQACHLGYNLDQAEQGRGLMHEALRAVIACAFETLQLHRIQANYQPENVRSAAVLRRLGFVVEGHAKDYLFLDGAWRDHVLTALTNPDFDPARMLA
ncbi:GNAT family N-acetyltransferase [Pseudogulbenkiania ferrooxidans]|uniref:GCN5-related N-acetyltransferase n=1 Tax=Pseudogulbenkiania ferrooxidans 2002 TaxID=279714 RepID=B9Z5W6_9NEIS|nr:GNAT family N-acetyltransferase [Pseudogulbenkiania ferrooxidans]EEG07963.1 GCN5-related N-acetyltransferase [Pseudogulbenkiania ferrooxidans 2002]